METSGVLKDLGREHIPLRRTTELTAHVPNTRATRHARPSNWRHTMNKILMASVAAFGLFAAGATFSAVNPAARPAITIAGENTGHYQDNAGGNRFAGENTGNRYDANKRYAGENTGHYQDNAGGNKFAGENTGRRSDSNQQFAGENTGHYQDNAGGNKFAGENTGRRSDSNQQFAGGNTGHYQDEAGGNKFV
eukprot:gene14967-15106_t